MGHFKMLFTIIIIIKSISRAPIYLFFLFNLDIFVPSNKHSLRRQKFLELLRALRRQKFLELLREVSLKGVWH